MNYKRLNNNKKIIFTILLSLFFLFSCDDDPCYICDYDEECIIIAPEDQNPFDALFGEDEIKCVPSGTSECEYDYQCNSNEHCDNGSCRTNTNICENIECEDGYVCLPSIGECVKKQNQCDGITCSGHGVCIEEEGYETICACNTGYVAVGLRCVKDNCDNDYECDNGNVCNLSSNTCEPSACDFSTCSTDQKCIVDRYNNPSCVCRDGLEERNGKCVAIDSCEEIICGHGKCEVKNEKASCNCDNGYISDGNKCVVDPCYDVTCSDHGKCVVEGNLATCKCDDDFEANGLECVPLDPCYGVTCSDHGVCKNNNGVAECVCNHGYKVEALECIEKVHQSLRIELTWDKPGNLDLHLRKPGEDATAWGTEDRDCFYNDCSTKWYKENDYNPVFIIGDNLGTGPEIINIDKITEDNKPFTIAVHNQSNENRPTATVKIYCNDKLNSQFTTVIPNYGSQSKSFWQVSNLTLKGDLCETSPLGLGDYPGED